MKTVLQKLKNIEVKNNLDKYSISHLYLFGSYARWEEKKDSDLDIMIEYNRDKHKLTMFDLVKIESYFKAEIWVNKVDIVTKKSINKHLKPFIEKDLIKIY